MKHRISIVYHSESGRTKQLAQEVFKGINEYKNIECKIMVISDCDYDFMGLSHAVIFGSPTYYGGMSWQMKKFIDKLRDHVSLEGKIGSAFCSGKSFRGGSETTLIGIYQSLLIYGMLIYTGGTKKGLPSTHYGAALTGCFVKEDFLVCQKLGKNIAEKVIELF